jgi:hypothetical protein
VRFRSTLISELFYWKKYNLLNTRPKYSFTPDKNIALLIFGIAFFLAAFFLFPGALGKKYPQLFEVLLLTILLVTGLYLIYFYLNPRIVYLYENFIAFRSGVFLREVKIQKSEIISWSEIHKTAKNTEWDELTIFTNSAKYNFLSKNYKGYGLLKEKLTEGVQRNSGFEDDWQKRITIKAGKIMIISGIFFMFFCVKSCQKKDEKFDSTQLTEINEIVVAGIKIEKASKGRRVIKLQFDSYPEYRFKIDGIAFHAMDTEAFVSETNKGDTLTVSIKKEDYEKKLIKSRPLDFFDKSIYNPDIDIFSLSRKEKRYLSLDQYQNEFRDSHDTYYYLYGIIGFFLLLGGIFTIINSRNS